ncbi:PucR family transcriptional regulator ligand-binding domain-containing protein [Paenarthrobacter sp. TYUT067]|uniref:PucR family transcriptional regulator n=1 Tax=Paenarthrobacter sp. TYUT067 TaxID=2926245 RepID=UPI00202EE872|nr:PucR family transcriptional regulator [Paenarthrobacter sp. TYUT067]MCM0618157.1 PucR family transcriptional regulator ligand-binding domain-containing protein [Paenarthrobacter sp. TYUT067]
MSIALGSALKSQSLKSAEPRFLNNVPEALSRGVRWVHSSEVLDIAPLLSGGELLLSGGQALAGVTAERQADYVRELAARGIAALALETGPALPEVPAGMLEIAEAAGLPVIELRHVVPFVAVMQEINSLLVSESVEHLQRGDQASHAMAAELAHGGGLDQLLAVLSEKTGASARLLSPSGVTLSSAGSFEVAGSVTIVDVPVRGVLAARLELHMPDDGDGGLARVAGERSVDILGLALLQRMPPGLKELAGIELMRAINSGGQHWQLQQLGPASGFPAQGAVAAVVIRSTGAGHLRPAVDALLRLSVPHSASYADNAELIAVAALGEGDATRRALVEALRGLEVPTGSLVAVGPLGNGIAEAPWSLAEARRAFDLASPGKGVVDADTLAVELLAQETLDPATREGFVQRQLGAVVEHDRLKKSQLMRTLSVWLDTGCNTAQAARELHLERQSLHHRLQRIFELCGGDPRGNGRLAALHLATRLARV